MGVPGLTRNTKQFLLVHDRDFFKGGDFYLDALNFSFIDPTYGFCEFEEELERSRKVIDKLKALEPYSITFVADAMISKEKFKVRIQRSVRSVKSNDPWRGIFKSLSTTIIDEPGINYVLSGTEAEDEIMKLIEEDAERGNRKQFVFSDDSDTLCFNISHPENVEIIPMNSAIDLVMNSRPFAATLNLSTVLRSGVIKKSIMINPPIPRLGQSVLNPPKMRRVYTELVNCGLVYNHIFIRLGNMVSSDYKPPKWFAPCDSGIAIRRAAYGLIITQNFDNSPEFNKNFVKEWFFRGTEMVVHKVRPLEPGTIGPVIQLLRGTPLECVIENQIELVADKYRISDREIKLVTEYVKCMAHRTKPELNQIPSNVDNKTYQLSAIIKAIIECILLVEECLEDNFIDHQKYPHHSYYSIMRSMTPSALQCFINASK